MIRFSVLWAASVVLLATSFVVHAQAPLEVYTDNLANGWQNWSWSSTIGLNNSSPVHSGSHSISVSAQAWGALSLHHAELDMALYSSLSFWIHGGSIGGQLVQVITEYGTNSSPRYALSALQAGQWQHYDIPLATLGVATVTDLHRITFQLTGNGGTGVFYLDDIELSGLPVPAEVNLQVDATKPVRTVDSRWFGVNTAIWDGYFGTPQTISMLGEMGMTVLRFPGGSLSDFYHWATARRDDGYRWDPTKFADFVNVATNVGAQTFITVNYGTGTPEEAAGWVRHANVTNHLGFKYWEIGNENYGTWEADDNVLPNHAYTYAVRAQQYIAQMKAADPTIKIGVVVAPGEENYANGYSDHPAYNPRTGETHNGWTPVLLATLKSLGVTPDFAVHHHYPQWTDPNNPSASPDDDVLLLQSTSNWARDAADLRQQIEDYFGPEGTNIELLVTENNSDAGAQGRQSTSLVNGLYYADSLGQLMQTEFNAFLWWDLRNGTDTGGYFGSELYGWRDYGDLGMINGLETRHPSFYAAKLMQYFARGGDTVIEASSDYPMLSAYAVRGANGSVTVLVVNKARTNSLNGLVTLNGFSPKSEAVVRSFGIPQDEASRTGGSAAEQDIAQTTFTQAAPNFSYDFTPLSLTLITLSPAAPRLVATAPSGAGEFNIEIQGQPQSTYVIQRSTNFMNWESVSTNTLTDSTLIVTNSVSAGASMQFWRAVWQP